MISTSGKAINKIALSNTLLDNLTVAQPSITCKAVGQAQLVDNLLSKNEVDNICAELNEYKWQAVGLDGIASHYVEGNVIGSFRATIDSEILAQLLWNRLKNEFGGNFMGANAVGLNSRLRCIRYGEGGTLIPHYDSPFYYDDGQCFTQKTVVIYLGKNGTGSGGQTRFLHDAQNDLPTEVRNYDDWNRLAEEHEIEWQVDGQAGQALIFAHRLLHDSAPLIGNISKTIIRTDIVYRNF